MLLNLIDCVCIFYFHYTVLQLHLSICLEKNVISQMKYQNGPFLIAGVCADPHSRSSDGRKNPKLKCGSEGTDCVNMFFF